MGETVQDFLPAPVLAAALAELKTRTPSFAQRVDELIFRFGHLEESDPERQILASKVKEVLIEWSSLVMGLGGQPKDLWTAVFHGPQGEIQWQYPCSVLRSPKN